LSSGRDLRIDSLACESSAACAVQVKAAFSTLRDGQILQDLGLQRGTEPFGFLDAVVLGERPPIPQAR
jgi:hypothetical protein